MGERHHQFWPAGVPHAIDVPPLRIHDNLSATASRVPEATAISYYGTSISYRRLEAECRQLACYLQWELGVACGDRVVLLMQNSPQFVIAYYAILIADAVVVPLNPMLQAAELGRIATELEARVVICGGPQLTSVATLIGQGVLVAAIVARYGDYVRAADVPSELKLPGEVERGQGIR